MLSVGIHNKAVTAISKKIMDIGVTDREVNNIALAKAIADYAGLVPVTTIENINLYVMSFITPKVEAIVEDINNIVYCNTKYVISAAVLMITGAYRQANPSLYPRGFNKDHPSKWISDGRNGYTTNELEVLSSREAFDLCGYYGELIMAIHSNGEEDTDG